jgi:uncharacterized protein (TIGR02996 family)
MRGRAWIGRRERYAARVQRTGDPPELSPLFDAVFRAPADDAPRQVLADALLERGDARGEFISLQLLEARGVATQAQRARAANLLKHHVRRWLIDAPGLANRPGLEFVRGFLRSATLEPAGVGQESPLWRSLERLHVRPSQYRPLELAAPALTRLEVLTGLDGEALTVLVQGPDKPVLRELALNGPAVEEPRPSKRQEDVLALTRFRALEALTLSPRPWRHHADRHAWLFESPLARHLRRLRLAAEPPWDVFGLHGVLSQQRLERLTVETSTAGLTLSFDLRALTVRFDDARSFDRLSQTLRNLAPRFAPHPFERFELRIADRRATRGELERLGEAFLRHAG